MARRINPRRTDSTAAAKMMIERYGGNAERQASHRYDAAATETTAEFYEQVMSEIDRLCYVEPWRTMCSTGSQLPKKRRPRLTRRQRKLRQRRKR